MDRPYEYTPREVKRVIEPADHREEVIYNNGFDDAVELIERLLVNEVRYFETNVYDDAYVRTVVKNSMEQFKEEYKHD